MKKFLLAFLFLLGCNKTSEANKAPEPSWEARQAEHIVYVQDPRTNLCFALSTVSEYPIGTAVILTHVPCSSGVMNLIQK